jgi:quercetin dioxygenase-like cupin family protein
MSLTHQIRTSSRNFEQLAGGLDLSLINDEIQAQGALFDKSTFRQSFNGSPFKDTQFIGCRMTYDLDHEPTEEEMLNHLKTKGVTTTNAVDLEDYELLPQVYGAVMLFAGVMQAEQIGRVLVTRLHPGGKIGAHKDFGEYHNFYDRFHICIGGKGCHFRSGKETVKMMPGEVWWFYNNLEHEVWNESDLERDHIVIDLKLKGDKMATRESIEGAEL